MATGAFPSLFAPMSPADFLARHWKRRPLYAEGAAWPSHLRFTLADLKARLASFPQVKAQFLSGGRHRETAIDGAKAQDFYDAGMSICVASVDKHDPTLEEFAGRLRDELRFAGDILFNCYWSPKGGGFGTHFDEQHVFILQVEGSKRWFISEGTGCEAPPGNLVYSPENAAAFRARHGAMPLVPPDEDAFREHVLKPGDCLYLPPGTWHRTAAGDFSLALTLTLSYVRLGEIVSTVARRRLERSLPWREVLPVAASVEDRREFLEARVAELREFAEALTPEMLDEEWLRATLGDKPAGTPTSEGFGDRDVLLRQLRLEVCPSKDDAGDDVLVLLWPGGRCEIPGGYEPFCRRLASATRLTLDEARLWTDDGEPLDAEDTRGVLERLVDSGLLRRA